MKKSEKISLSFNPLNLTPGHLQPPFSILNYRAAVRPISETNIFKIYSKLTN